MTEHLKETRGASDSARILRSAAESSESLREMWTRLAALPYEDVRALALELADLLEAAHSAPSEGTHGKNVSALQDACGENAALRSFGSDCALDAPISRGEAPRKAPEKQKKSDELKPPLQASAGKQTMLDFGASPPSRPAQSPEVSSSAPNHPEKEGRPGELAQAGDSAAVRPAVPRKILLFSDGAARGNPGPSGAGAVLMLPDGRIIARLGKYLGQQTNNYAEYSAFIMGLEAALKLGAEEVEATADSQLMVRQLNGQYRVKDARLQELFGKARSLMARFRKVSVRHVLREYNHEADEMSNRAIDERM